MKMPAHLDYDNLDEIKRQKIFRKGEYPKLDQVFNELMADRDLILKDFLEFAQGGTIQEKIQWNKENNAISCLLYTSPSPRDRQKSRMPSSA